MTDERKLLTPSRDEVLQSIEFSMKFRLGKPIRTALDVAVQTLAQMVIDHLELSGYVILKRPPVSAHSTPGSRSHLKD